MREKIYEYPEPPIFSQKTKRWRGRFIQGDGRRSATPETHRQAPGQRGSRHRAMRDNGNDFAEASIFDAVNPRDEAKIVP
jgi:hypothetical protein